MNYLLCICACAAYSSFNDLIIRYETSDHTDAVIKVKDGEKRVHSLGKP